MRRTGVLGMVGSAAQRGKSIESGLVGLPDRFSGSLASFLGLSWCPRVKTRSFLGGKMSSRDRSGVRNCIAAG
jgi:hypothetical protein